MRYVLFVSTIIAAAFTYASGQVREPSLEKGQIEDLRGIIKVYVGTSNQSTSQSTTRTIIETVRKRLPQITIVSLQEEADVWLLFSAETGNETESNPEPSLDGRSGLKFVTILRSQGRVIRVRRPNLAKLVKKFSATGKSTDGNRLARDFAEGFIKLYWQANPRQQYGVTPHSESEEKTPSLVTEATTGDAGEPALPNTLTGEPEPSLREGKIEDLKGVARVYVDAPDHYSSLFLRIIVENIRKKIPYLVFVWDRGEADVWLLFSVASNVRDARVRGRIIRSLGPGRLRLVKQYSAEGNKGADGFAEEFVKSYQKANPVSQAAVAPLQQTTSSPPQLKGESGPVAVAAGQTSVRNAGNGTEVGDGDVLRIDTSLVTIHANVIGRDGKPAPDMHRDDFSVYEDDVKQHIAFFEPVDRPFTVVLLIDSSISVEAQLTEIVKAAKVLVDRLRPDDQLVIITFDAMVKEVLKLTKIRELREWTKISPQGGTRLYDAVDFAASQYLRRLPGRKAVVLLTDGVDFGSFITTAEGSLHDAEEYDALFYTIQYKTSEPQPRPSEKAQQAYERATAYLRGLAEKTGGRYQRAEAMGDLSPAFASVVKELSCQYSLGYYPMRPPQPGERRRIRVRVDRSDLVIHARDSYVFKSPEAKQAEPK